MSGGRWGPCDEGGVRLVLPLPGARHAGGNGPRGRRANIRQAHPGGDGHHLDAAVVADVAALSLGASLPKPTTHSTQARWWHTLAQRGVWRPFKMAERCHWRCLADCWLQVEEAGVVCAGVATRLCE